MGAANIQGEGAVTPASCSGDGGRIPAADPVSGAVRRKSQPTSGVVEANTSRALARDDMAARRRDLDLRWREHHKRVLRYRNPRIEGLPHGTAPDLGPTLAANGPTGETGDLVRIPLIAPFSAR
jgi:hypothetical protein